MCYDDHARPPAPPGAPGEAHGEDLVLTAADGNRFAAFFANPARPSGPKVLIYPDVRGLHQFYKELALRFAETGSPALALDYFGRTAGLTGREESFEFMPHVQQMRLESFTQDVEAGLEYLRAQGEASAPVYVVGFCMGGSLALMTGTNPELGFSGLIPFYSGFTRSFGDRGTALDNAGKVVYPVLGLYGGADPSIPESDLKTLEERLAAAGVPHNIVIYPGATHSFFDRRATEFADASADAWKRVLAFLASGNPGAA